MVSGRGESPFYGSDWEVRSHTMAVTNGEDLSNVSEGEMVSPLTWAALLASSMVTHSEKALCGGPSGSPHSLCTSLPAHKQQSSMVFMSVTTQFTDGWDVEGAMAICSVN